MVVTVRFNVYASRPDMKALGEGRPGGMGQPGTRDNPACGDSPAPRPPEAEQ
ncbi:MAG TPA: hypothetical protein VF070_13235 [Streptosporangiaceae bacterium]